MTNYLPLAKGVVTICGLFVVYLLFWGQTNIFSREPSPVNKHGSLDGRVELTLRMGLFQKDIHHFFCSLLRSMVLFWDPRYGDVFIILDAEDSAKGFDTKLNSLRLPFRFRFYYEAPPPKKVHHLAKMYRGYGYLRQIYSSFIMDMYTSSPIIGWIDTDVIMTMPVLEQSIVTKDNKLIAKGIYSFYQEWVKNWDKGTLHALGLPMVADFMSYFPVYVYASTIKNCRLYIMKRLGAKDFDDAFIKMHVTHLSPVNMIMSYAYYFERDLYDWHIATGPHKLETYNKDRLPKHPLLLKELSPDPHVSIHVRYYQSPFYPLEQAICYTQIHLGVANISHCKQFYGKTNMQLYEFQNGRHPTFAQQWCQGNARNACSEVIETRYNRIVKLYDEGKVKLNVTWVHKIEDIANKEYKEKCAPFKYVPFPRPNRT